MTDGGEGGGWYGGGGMCWQRTDGMVMVMVVISQRWLCPILDEQPYDYFSSVRDGSSKPDISIWAASEQWNSRSTYASALASGTGKLVGCQWKLMCSEASTVLFPMSRCLPAKHSRFQAYIRLGLSTQNSDSDSTICAITNRNTQRLTSLSWYKCVRSQKWEPMSNWYETGNPNIGPIVHIAPLTKSWLARIR